MPRERILALVLAGGTGSRLEVLTEERAKPAMPFAGVYRLIDFPLSHCVHSGLSDVWVIEQYELHSLNEHLANGRPWDLDRTYGGLQVLPPFSHREKSADEGGFAHGNADAIYRHRALIREFAPELLLVLSADHLYRLDYGDLIARHREGPADLTLVTTRVAREEAHRFGLVEVDGEGRVTGFAYKPESPASDLATAEVFLYDASALLAALDDLAGEGDGAGEAGEPGEPGKENEAALGDFGDRLLPRLVAGGRVRELRLGGYWRDVGTLESYWQGHMDLLAPEPPLVLDDPAWPILTYGTQRLPARIDRPARLAECLISPGCRIAGRVERSVLGPGVVVEEGAVVRGSVLLEGVTVAARANVERAILDAEVHVGAGAAVGGPGEEPPGGDGLAVVGRRARVPPGARLPPGARVKPGTVPPSS